MCVCERWTIVRASALRRSRNRAIISVSSLFIGRCTQELLTHARAHTLTRTHTHDSPATIDGDGNRHHATNAFAFHRTQLSWTRVCVCACVFVVDDEIPNSCGGFQIRNSSEHASFTKVNPLPK